MTTPDVQKKAPEAPTQTGKGSLMPFIAAAVFATGSTGAAAQDIILGTQNYNQGCYDTQNVLSPNSSSKMEMMINGEPMNLVVQRDTNGRVNLILAEKRDRTWFAGRCFDVWNGQVYPTYPNPDGKGVTRSNPYGTLSMGVKDEKGKSVGGGYFNIQGLVKDSAEGRRDISKNIDTSNRDIGANMDRFTRILLEHPELDDPDTQDAFIATLLQLQYDLKRNPTWFSSSKAGRGNAKTSIDFIEKHLSPSFLEGDDLKNYQKLANQVIKSFPK